MRNLTEAEIKAIAPHFYKIAKQYTKLGQSKTTQEFKKSLIELVKLSDDDQQPQELTRLWKAMLIEIHNGSN